MYSLTTKLRDSNEIRSNTRLISSWVFTSTVVLHWGREVKLDFVEKVWYGSSMSKFFLRKFHSEHKCLQCKDDKISGYSLCPRHLLRARYQWRAWGTLRRALGMCCQCDRKSFKGWLRCKLHTMLNRKRCKAWNKAHPEHGKEAWAARMAYKEAGFCPQCQQHRKLREGENRCWVCSVRNSLRNKIGVEGMKAVMRERYGTRFDRKMITAA